MTDNNVVKYLLYATSEIILVVIGILIAIQIDNWNDERKLEKLELALLSEMIQNLQRDINHMKTNIFIYDRAINSSATVLAVFENQLSDQDSLNKHYGRVFVAPKFLPTESAYRSINDEGIRIIKNDSLRDKIVALYDEHYTFLTALADEEWSRMFQDSHDVYRKYFTKFDLYEDLVPVKYKDLRQNKEYLNYLNNRLGWMRFAVGVYNDRINDAEKLVGMIKKELMNRAG
jgi:hypothetical protein